LVPLPEPGKVSRAPKSSPKVGTHPSSSGAGVGVVSAGLVRVGLYRNATVMAFCLSSMAAAYGLFDRLGFVRGVAVSLRTGVSLACRLSVPGHT
jgi:hypothetical protein